MGKYGVKKRGARSRGMLPVRLICILALCIGVLAAEGLPVWGKEENSTNIQLYARSAVLMDADSGRVLFGKNEGERMPMASTTKIMTCILALEKGNQEDTVTVSSYAASQPKVHLGMYKEQQFRLKDLLYSLMLESHNDAAAAIAEHIGGSVEGFAGMMNRKARELGCEDTFFITPNGLDAAAADEEGNARVHSTTARDLARMMKYCIGESVKREEFLEITRTQNYSFTDLKGERSYSCYNHNAFLSMMEGALSGKTGFTNNAGYCYVGALKRDSRTFIVALLACGWPNNKGYKWSDAKTLMAYGLENYAYRNVYEEEGFRPLAVEGGIPENNKPYGKACVEVGLEEGKPGELNVLLREGEQVEKRVSLPERLTAPVEEGAVIGSVEYFLEGVLLKKYPVVAKADVGALNFSWMVNFVWKLYAL
ncbi:MAG: D-alanyl-D-alanine carboxypeptidase family protein [Kineothrix sp.]